MDSAPRPDVPPVGQLRYEPRPEDLAAARRDTRDKILVVIFIVVVMPILFAAVMAGGAYSAVAFMAGGAYVGGAVGYSYGKQAR